MLYQILAHTPIWVGAIFTVLLWAGLVQTKHRRAKLGRVVVVLLVMTSLSLDGTFSSFGVTPTSWAMWAGAGLLTLLWVGSSALPVDLRYDESTRTFDVPGSWIPLGLMMTIFCTNYAVRVMLALTPALSHDTATTAIVASLHGAMSGVFAGRMVRMLRAAHAGSAKRSAATTVTWG